MAMVQEDKAWYDLRMDDGGPVYAETDPSQFIVEPWNALSSLLYMLPALIWIYKLRGEYGQFKFMLFASILVILGSLGSTLFHAFRTSSFFLVMDVLPVAILALSLSILFWIRVFNSWVYMLLVVIPLTGLRFVMFNSLPDNLAINLSYALTGLMILAPLGIIHLQGKLVKPRYILYTLVSFALALLFREMDSWQTQILPMGTHFLWHAFSGIGTYYILAFLYRFRLKHLESA